jgi:hypothetical protein
MGGDDECYSPTQNWETAYDEGSVGCACEASEPGQCIQGTALVCESGHWQAVVDGPCFPGPGEVCGAGFCSQFGHCDELAPGGPTCVANP